MGSPSFEEIQKIYTELILPFYKVKRDMYVSTENGRVENDAEHSWSLAFLAFMLAPRIDKTLDVSKTVIYALVHDMVEIFVGDTSVWANQSEHDTKKTREDKAVKKLVANQKEYKNFQTYLLNYYNKADAEALFIYALDKFHNWMIAYIGKEAYYKKYRKITKEQADVQLALARPKAYTHPKIGEYYDRIVEAFDKHPEYFYTKET